VREFDEAYTAPYFGFKDAEDYYHRASAMRVIDRVRLPALIIAAEDDPFVPARSFHEPQVAGNRHITLLACRHGGHCGFVGPAAAHDDGYWAEHRIVDFIERHASRTRPSAAERFP
jgi:predicted alpha/beta-fold hydrolase